MQKEKGLIWFTNNLRAIDNKVLYEASKRSDSLIGYYNFDPLLFKRNIWGFKKTEKYRTKFLIESIDNLKKNLSQLNITLVIDFSECWCVYISIYVCCVCFLYVCCFVCVLLCVCF